MMFTRVVFNIIEVGDRGAPTFYYGIASETGNEMQNEISLVNSAFSVPFSETNFLIRYIVGFTTVLAV